MDASLVVVLVLCLVGEISDVDFELFNYGVTSVQLFVKVVLLIVFIA